MRDRRNKEHPIKSVDIFEHDLDGGVFWTLTVKRGNTILEQLKPRASLWSVIKHALGNHCGFDDEPKEPTIHALDPKDTVTLLS